jgi:hypothetical protein
VALIRTDVSEDRIASIFRVHECELVTERSCKLLYRHRQALKDQSRDRRLTIRRYGQPRKWTQGDGGPWQKVDVNCGQLTRHAVPHCVRVTFMRDEAGTVLQEEPLKMNTIEMR